MPSEPAKHIEDCQEVFALLSEYLDAELPPEFCQEIATHLSGCPPCIQFVESLRRTIELCRRAKQAEESAPLGEGARRELLAAYEKMLAARRATTAE